MIAIDLAKDNFQIYGIDKNGNNTVDRKMNRLQMIKFFSNLKQCQVFMEACGGSNHWGRKLKAMGFEVKLISPQHVKPFVGRQKNDRNDARAILEASRRLEAKFVSIKELWQQDLQSLHRVRERRQKTLISISNQIRGLLIEYGVSIPQGGKALKDRIYFILEDSENELTSQIRSLVKDVYEEYLSMEELLTKITKKIEDISKQNETCKSLQKLSGVGPLVSTALIASVGSANHFKNGRQMSAWLGLVPRQISSGNTLRLSGITKNGDRYLRQIIVQGARAKLSGVMRKQAHTGESLKLLEKIKNKGFNKVAIAEANRNTRKMWAIMMEG